MLRFPQFENIGVACAAISDASDGDCGASDDPQTNRARFLTRCTAKPRALVCPNQVHGTNIYVAEDNETPNPTADGLLTQIPDLPIAITVADCVPVFLLDPIHRVVGLAHAGREGTYLGVTKALVEKAQHIYDVNPADLHAIIGPAAGPCCYQVSNEIAQRFKDAGLPVNNRNIDLWAANQQQLIAAGLTPHNIETTRHCTICKKRFHSFRRTKTADRNLALLLLKTS